MNRIFVRRAVPILAATILAACSDDGVTEGGPGGPGNPPVPATPVHLVELVCTAEVRAGTTYCGAPTPEAGSAGADVTIGGQGKYVWVRSANNVVTDVADPAVPDTFALDVTIQNLIPQAIGVLPDAPALGAGDPEIRLFFHVPPAATVGRGPVSVANADGVGSFTANQQPYFAYQTTLDSGEVSEPRRWKFAFAQGVDRFAFRVYVSAPVEYPNGWVDVVDAPASLASGTTANVRARIRDFLGETVTDADEEVTWRSGRTSQATVTPSATGAVVEGVQTGKAVIMASTATRPGRAASIEITAGPVATLANAGRTGLNAAPGYPIADSTVVMALDRIGNPVPGVVITWTTPDGGTVSPVGGVTDGAGLARTHWTVGTATGEQRVRAAAAGGANPTIELTATVDAQGRKRNWVGGAAAAPAAWAEPDNWLPRGIPTALDTVIVDASGSAVHVPEMSADGFVRLFVNTGTVRASGATLTALDSAFTTGALMEPGTLALRGGAVIGGAVPSLLLELATTQDTVRLVDRTQAQGSVTVNRGVLLLNGQRLYVRNDFLTRNGGLGGGGWWMMKTARDTLFVAGNMDLRGYSTLNAGVVEVKGNLETSGFTSAYIPAAAHVTIFSGTAAQRVLFGESGGKLGTVIVRNPVDLLFPPTARGSIVGGSFTLDASARITVPADVLLYIQGSLIVGPGAGGTNHGSIDYVLSYTNNSGSTTPFTPNAPH